MFFDSSIPTDIRIIPSENTVKHRTIRDIINEYEGEYEQELVRFNKNSNMNGYPSEIETDYGSQFLDRYRNAKTSSGENYFNRTNGRPQAEINHGQMKRLLEKPPILSSTVSMKKQRCNLPTMQLPLVAMQVDLYNESNNINQNRTFAQNECFHFESSIENCSMQGNENVSVSSSIFSSSVEDNDSLGPIDEWIEIDSNTIEGRMLDIAMIHPSIMNLHERIQAMEAKAYSLTTANESLRKKMLRYQQKQSEEENKIHAMEKKASNLTIANDTFGMRMIDDQSKNLEENSRIQAIIPKTNYAVRMQIKVKQWEAL